MVQHCLLCGNTKTSWCPNDGRRLGIQIRRTKQKALSSLRDTKGSGIQREMERKKDSSFKRWAGLTSIGSLRVPDPRSLTSKIAGGRLEFRGDFASRRPASFFHETYSSEDRYPSTRDPFLRHFPPFHLFSS